VVRPVAGGHGEQRVPVAEVAAAGGLVRPLLRRCAVEGVHEDDEQLQLGAVAQLAQGRLGLRAALAEHPGAVGQLLVQPQRVVGAGRRGREAQRERRQGQDVPGASRAT
jgi:hypothetical protein